jgi:hypothetical protein
MSNHKLIFQYGGETYITEPSDGKGDIDTDAEAIYENINNFNKLQVKLQGGGWLILPKHVIERCVIAVVPVEESE